MCKICRVIVDLSADTDAGSWMANCPLQHSIQWSSLRTRHHITQSSKLLECCMAGRTTHNRDCSQHNSLQSVATSPFRLRLLIFVRD